MPDQRLNPLQFPLGHQGRGFAKVPSPPVGKGQGEGEPGPKGGPHQPNKQQQSPLPPWERARVRGTGAKGRGLPTKQPTTIPSPRKLCKTCRSVPFAKRKGTRTSVAQFAGDARSASKPPSIPPWASRARFCKGSLSPPWERARVRGNRGQMGGPYQTNNNPTPAYTTKPPNHPSQSIIPIPPIPVQKPTKQPTNPPPTTPPNHQTTHHSPSFQSRPSRFKNLPNHYQQSPLPSVGEG